MPRLGHVQTEAVLVCVGIQINTFKQVGLWRIYCMLIVCVLYAGTPGSSSNIRTICHTRRNYIVIVIAGIYDHANADLPQIVHA